MTHRNSLGRLGRAALALAAATGLGLALTPVGPAFAADGTTIDPNAATSLTIVRYDNSTPESSTPATGTTDDKPKDGKFLAGASYTAAPVLDGPAPDGKPLDLTKQSAWEYLTSLGQATPGNLGNAISGDSPNVTDAKTGTVTFTTLKVGAYWVTESLSPEAQAAGYSPVDPFLVTIPMTNPNDPDNWNYNPIVYPKSKSITISKGINDADDFGRGATVDWTITAPVPADRPKAALTSLSITDDFNGQVGITADSIKVFAKLKTENSPEYPLTADTNYTLAGPDIAENRWGRFTVTPTLGSEIQTGPEGTPTATALTNKSVDSIIVRVSAPVLNVTDDGALLDKTTAGVTAGPDLVHGDLYDQAKLSATWEGGFTAAPVASVVTKWGTLTVTKTRANSETAIPGAQFAIFNSATDAQNAVKAGQAGATDLSKALTFRLPGGSETTQLFTTDDNGKFTVPGLRFSDFYNNATGTSHPYYLAEVKAAPTYELNPEVKEFVIDKDNVDLQLSVTDAPSNGGFKLPLAGGPGIAALLGLGLLLMAGSYAAYRRLGASDRKRSS